MGAKRPAERHLSGATRPHDQFLPPNGGLTAAAKVCRRLRRLSPLRERFGRNSSSRRTSRVRSFFLTLVSVAITAAASAAVTFSNFWPTTGPTSGGTAVVISGSGFFGGCATPCLPVEITFDGVAATSVRVESDSRITLLTPEQNLGELALYHDYVPTAVKIKIGAYEGLWWNFRYSDAVYPPPDVSRFQRILVPVYNCRLGGVNGSSWCTDLSAFNPSDDGAVIYPVYTGWKAGKIAGAVLPSEHFVAIDLLIPGDFYEVAPRVGRILYVDPDHADSLRLNLRVYDRSRTTATWGTEVPLVRENELRTNAIEIFPVPTNTLFRQSLRIYDPFRTAGAEVEVRFYTAKTAKLITTRRVALTVYERTVYDGSADLSFPGLAEFNNLLAEVPELANMAYSPELRIEIVPLTPGLRFWAMVSLTNNETQQVTLLTPQ